MIFIIIGILSLILGILGIYQGTKNNNENLWGISIFVIVFFSVIFLGAIPAFKVDHYETDEIKNAYIEIGEKLIAIDLTNADPDLNKHSKVFNSYKAVTEFNDSTKIYYIQAYSYYGLRQSSKIVWSNPPYKKFNEN